MGDQHVAFGFGEPVAAVFAPTPAQAEDAADRVDVVLTRTPTGGIGAGIPHSVTIVRNVRVLAINAADDERNPPETGLTEAAMKRVRNGRLLHEAGIQKE